MTRATVPARHFNSPQSPQSLPPTVSPRRRPGSISRYPPAARSVSRLHHPRMDPGLRRGDTELGNAPSGPTQKILSPPPPSPPQSTPSPCINCAVATNGRHGDNRGAWVARLVRGCQRPAGRWLEADRDLEVSPAARGRSSNPKGRLLAACAKNPGAMARPCFTQSRNYHIRGLGLAIAVDPNQPQVHDRAALCLAQLWCRTRVTAVVTRRA